MAGESKDKYSIKNILFSRAIPSYVTPIPIEGYKVYGCTDCGDKFLIESSYQYHVNRKSVKITYFCRHCNMVKVFKNRCNLLSHIRSHAFKTATINVTDLKVELFPLEDYKTHQSGISFCFECKKNIFATGNLMLDRKNHYMSKTNETYMCPVCMFVWPTHCALQAHLRIHLRKVPCFCPECGMNVPNSSTVYPFNHDCEGFKMIRATARIACPIDESQCSPVHPSLLHTHIENHMKQVYKCPCCIIACFDKETIETHMMRHEGIQPNSFIVVYQCPLCPERAILSNQLEYHSKKHACTSIANAAVYPCWSCSKVFSAAAALIHHCNGNCEKTKSSKNNFNNCDNSWYKVVKKCDRCKKLVTFRRKIEEISDLPSVCPYNCTPAEGKEIETTKGTLPESQNAKELEKVKCNLCERSVSSLWSDIKLHYAEFHQKYRCLDAVIKLHKLDMSEFLKNKKRRAKRARKALKEPSTAGQKNIFKSKKSQRKLYIKKEDSKRQERIGCAKCNTDFNDRESFENHLLTHRDPCTAYQCFECGHCFVVKTSFSTHLLVKHDISNCEEYIKNKPCYNETAFSKYQSGVTPEEPTKENQCNICGEEFDCIDNLEKHFRVHGMAFLLKKAKSRNAATL